MLSHRGRYVVVREELLREADADGRGGQLSDRGLGSGVLLGAARDGGVVDQDVVEAVGVAAELVSKERDARIATVLRIL